jgi:hypothetical protein
VSTGFSRFYFAMDGCQYVWLFIMLFRMIIILRIHAVIANLWQNKILKNQLTRNTVAHSSGFAGLDLGALNRTG